MDPEEAMSRLRDAMIQISDLVSGRLVQGGSVLNKSELETAVDAAEDIVSVGKDLLDFARRGGYLPVGR
jgi:hypothetical protein